MGHRNRTLTALGVRACVCVCVCVFPFKLGMNARQSVIRQGWKEQVRPRWEPRALCYGLREIWQRRVRKITRQLWILSSSPFSAPLSSFSTWETLTNAILYFQYRGETYFQDLPYQPYVSCQKIGMLCCTVANIGE